VFYLLTYSLTYLLLAFVVVEFHPHNWGAGVSFCVAAGRVSCLCVTDLNVIAFVVPRDREQQLIEQHGSRRQALSDSAALGM